MELSFVLMIVIRAKFTNQSIKPEKQTLVATAAESYHLTKVRREHAP